MTVRRALQHLWCLPLTVGALWVIGSLWLIVAIVARLRGRARTAWPHAALVRDNRGPIGVWLCSPSIAHLLARHPAGPMHAAVTGHIVWASLPFGLTPPHIRQHEAAHVRQSLCWGALFPLAYLASSWLAVWRGQDAYWDNAFEVAARAAEEL
jgi:hypothetical protein